MRRVDREIKDEVIIEDILNNSLYCHLGLSKDDQPYVVPLNFVYVNPFKKYLPALLYLYS